MNAPLSDSARARRWLQAVALGLIAAWVYAPTLHGDWLWDDLFEVPLNPMLGTWAGLGQIWTGPAGPDYLPLKQSLQWVQWHLWHYHHSGYHLTNIGLQALGAVLLWRTLARFRLRWAWIGGVLFLVHPLFVESVAWISELKNTLAFVPLLLAFGAYLDFDARAPGARRGAYLRALAWFAISMLCKSSGVMFPAVLLLYAWWRHRRVRAADVRASAAFFAISLALGAVTYWYQHHRAMVGWILYQGGLASRIAGAGVALQFYLAKFLWPFALLPIYPRWAMSPPAPVQFLPWLVLGVILAWLWTQRTAWGRAGLFGLGCFLLLIAPVLGFAAMSFLHIAPVADHLAYLPAVGLIGLAVAALERVPPRPGPTLAAGAAAAVLCAGLAWASHGYAGRFANQETLWAYTVARNPASPAVHSNLAFILGHDGQKAASVAEYREALRLAPDDAFAENELAQALEDAGQPAEAIAHFESAVRLDPRFIDPRPRLAHLLYVSGRLPEAVVQYRAALRLQPDVAGWENGLGAALADQGQWDEAISHYQTALRLDPNLPEAENNLGLVLAKKARWNEAIAHFELALKLKPDLAKAHGNLAFALGQTGRKDEAIQHFEQAARLDPDNAEYQNNLGFSLAQGGRSAEAIAPFERALRLNPADASAHYNLGALLQSLGRYQEARAQLTEALRLRPGFVQAQERLAQLPM